MPHYYRALAIAALAGSVALPAFAQTPAPDNAAPPAQTQNQTGTPLTPSTPDQSAAPETPKAAVKHNVHHHHRVMHAQKTPKPATPTQDDSAGPAKG